MPSLDDIIKKAKKNAQPSVQTHGELIRSGGESGIFKKDSVTGDVTISNVEIDSSPTSLFTPESIQEGAVRGVQRLMNLWNSRIPEMEAEFQEPSDYLNEANRLYQQYQGLRVKLDSAVAYSIGDTLNRCRDRFFETGTLNGLSWTNFLKNQTKFSPRIAYDFMNIASRLTSLKGRTFSMDQLRAILQLAKTGFPVNTLPEDAEDLTVKQLLGLTDPVKPVPDQRMVASVGRIVIWLSPLAAKVEQFAGSLNDLMNTNSADGKGTKLNAREKELILGSKQKLASMIVALDNVISRCP